MDRSTRWLDLGWVIGTNLLVVAGVALWGWPPGNVFVLFWIENVVLGAVTIVRIVTAEGAVPSDDPRAAGGASHTPSGSPQFRLEPGMDGPASRWGRAGFFVVHYGIFATVHAVFVGILAVSVGLSWSWWALGLPAVLIVLRYSIDLAAGWFAGGQRRRVTPDQAFGYPYPRLVVLHLATILGFFFAMPFAGSGRFGGLLADVRQWLAGVGLNLDAGGLVVLILMTIKTIADIALITGLAPTRLRPVPASS